MFGNWIVRKNVICWPAMPFFRALIPFIPGILSYPYTSTTVILLAFALGLLCLVMINLLGISLKFRLHLIPGFLFVVVLFTLGHLSMFFADTKNDREFIANVASSPLIAEISNTPKKGKSNYSFEMELKFRQAGGRWIKTGGKTLIMTRQDHYRMGDFVLILSTPQPLNVKTFGSPEYLGYLSRRHITHIIYDFDKSLKLLTKSKPNDPVQYLRHRILAIMNASFIDPNERALAKALLVGSRVDLDPELKSAYTNTGVIHVIAVSGMHLAIIYSLISTILKPIKTKRARIIRTIIVLTALWIFSLVCGASPSVIRSAVMFSFILVGETFSREHQIGNTLAGSAFLLLCIQPTLLWDIGFQLSYAAVASLVIYSRELSNLLMPENKILIIAWNTIATTISAQILTTPLVIYHFHQFPLIFLFSNLVAVPLSGIILILLFLVSLLHPLSLSEPVAKFTGMLMAFMNQRIVELDKVQYATIREIYINEYDIINIYLMLIALTLWWRSKK